MLGHDGTTARRHSGTTAQRVVLVLVLVLVNLHVLTMSFYLIVHVAKQDDLKSW